FERQAYTRRRRRCCPSSLPLARVLYTSRAAAADPACRLWLAGAWPPATGDRQPLWFVAGHGRAARADRRRDRHDDARGHDPRVARPYWPAIVGGAGDQGHLCPDHGLGGAACPLALRRRQSRAHAIAGGYGVERRIRSIRGVLRQRSGAAA